MPCISLLPAGTADAFIDGAILSPDELGELLGGQALLAGSRERAEQMVEQSRHERQRQQQIGYREGLERAATECTGRLLGYERSHHEALAQRQQDVIEATLMVLERIAPALAAGELVGALARQAIQEARQARHLVIKVHPGALPAIESELESWRRSCTWLESLRAIGDDTLREDDCVLESPHGFVNAGWRTQLAAIRSLMAGLGVAAAEGPL
jgi:flagellar biosynthesis/type III secretory pathway protein FliH